MEVGGEGVIQASIKFILYRQFVDSRDQNVS